MRVLVLAACANYARVCKSCVELLVLWISVKQVSECGVHLQQLWN